MVDISELDDIKEIPNAYLEYHVCAEKHFTKSCLAKNLKHYSTLAIRTWWRHHLEIFSAFLAICAWNSPVPSEFPVQRTVTVSFEVFFDLRLNKRLSKHSWGWWFETLSRPLWRKCNEYTFTSCAYDSRALEDLIIETSFHSIYFFTWKHCYLDSCRRDIRFHRYSFILQINSYRTSLTSCSTLANMKNIPTSSVSFPLTAGRLFLL